MKIQDHHDSELWNEASLIDQQKQIQMLSQTISKGREESVVSGGRDFTLSATNLDQNSFLSQPAEQLYMAVRGNDLQCIQNLFGSQREPSPSLELDTMGVSVCNIIDNKGNSLLHHAALNGNFWVFGQLIEFWKTQNEIQSLEKLNELHHWIDQRNVSGYGAVHLACFRGNLKILEIIKLYGGNMELKNSQDLMPIHISCQCDQSLLLAYLVQELGQNINVLNLAGGTPLHQASFFGSEACINLLLAWGGKVNLQDREGFTALHLAVISGNTTIVRKLIIKGAQINIKDNQGNTPYQTALQNQQDHIARMIGKSQRCNIRKFVGMKLKSSQFKSSLQQVLVFLLLFTVNGSYNFLFLLGIDLYSYIFTSMAFISLLLFLYLLVSDPGYIETHLKNTMMSLLQSNQPEEVCAECEVVKPIRSKHCEICKRCVSVYDHHCPWINNCVTLPMINRNQIGAKNHGMFLFFLFFILSTMIAQIAIIALVNFFDIKFGKLVLDISDGHGGYYDQVKTIAGYIILGTNFMLVVPLCTLFVIQIGNFCLNKTTYERFNSKQKQQDQQLNSLTASTLHPHQEIKQDSCLGNCITMGYHNKLNHKFQEDSGLKENLLVF